MSLTTTTTTIQRPRTQKYTTHTQVSSLRLLALPLNNTSPKSQMTSSKPTRSKRNSTSLSQPCFQFTTLPSAVSQSATAIQSATPSTSQSHEAVGLKDSHPHTQGPNRRTRSGSSTSLASNGTPSRSRTNSKSYPSASIPFSAPSTPLGHPGHGAADGYFFTPSSTPNPRPPTKSAPSSPRFRSKGLKPNSPNNSRPPSPRPRSSSHPHLVHLGNSFQFTPAHVPSVSRKMSFTQTTYASPAHETSLDMLGLHAFPNVPVVSSRRHSFDSDDDDDAVTFSAGHRKLVHRRSGGLRSRASYSEIPPIETRPEMLHSRSMLKGSLMGETETDEELVRQTYTNSL